MHAIRNNNDMNDYTGLAKTKTKTILRSSNQSFDFLEYSNEMTDRRRKKVTESTVENISMVRKPPTLNEDKDSNSETVSTAPATSSSLQNAAHGTSSSNEINTNESTSSKVSTRICREVDEKAVLSSSSTANRSDRSLEHSWINDISQILQNNKVTTCLLLIDSYLHLLFRSLKKLGYFDRSSTIPRMPRYQDRFCLNVVPSHRIQTQINTEISTMDMIVMMHSPYSTVLDEKYLIQLTCMTSTSVRGIPRRTSSSQTIVQKVQRI